MSDSIPFSLRHCGSLQERQQQFAESAAKHTAKMAKNPFSGDCKATAASTLAKDDPNYGRPVAGSKTERRGKNAAKHVNAEVVFLCDMIHQEGIPLPDGTAVIAFGELFQIYTRISNKLVGMLLRARKYSLLTFEGETLFQRRDDHVPIKLLKPIQEIRAELNEDQDFDVGVCHKAPR
ncbi:actin-binding Rho-activating protein-like isoform X2 [Portunus trituberculatus]|uniref:actin-binding Rho-activating protein-like isoform X2 n=1 Tax=Portunus trituberculatus TaxID=210409 RepID=UPI001E1CD80E|nr:actin-binding Rho-activating protein-like isoform X2 [Portunus trituberculatus]